MFHFPTDTTPQNLYQLNLSFSKKKKKMLKKTIDRTKFNMSIRYNSHDPFMVVKAIIASFRFEDEDEDEDEDENENEDQVQLLPIVHMLKSVTVMA